MPALANEVSVKLDETLQDLLAHGKEKKKTPKKKSKFPKTLFISRNHLPRNPGVMDCSNCLLPVSKTLKDTVITGHTHAVAALMTPVLCTWVPYAFSFAKTIIHKCPFCEIQLGVSEFKMFGETKGEKELITKSKDRIPKDSVERQESGGQPRPLILPSQMPTSSNQDGGMSKKNIEPEDNLVYAIAENKEDSDHGSSTPPRLVSRMSLPSLPFVRKVLSSAGVPKEIQYDVKLHPISLVEPSTPTKSEDEVAMQCLYTHLPHSQLSIIPQNLDEDAPTSKITRRGCRHKERHKLGPPHSQSRDASAEIAPELFSDDERGRTRSHERKRRPGDCEKCRKCNRPKKPKEDQNAAKEPTR